MTRILLLCLANAFGDKVGQSVAEKKGLLYLNIDHFVQYSLFNTSEMLLKCGKEYYDKQEKSAIKTASEFENMLYVCSYETYIKNRELLKNFQLTYLRLSKKQLEILNEKNIVINKIAFLDRDKILKKIGRVVECDDLDPEIFAQKVVDLE